jgi:hypothetical protein
MIDIPRESNESGGRDRRGRFASGNKSAIGNPHGRRVGRLRSALLAAVKPSDMKVVIRKMVDRAKGGDVAAARVLFDRVFGPCQPADLISRLEELENLLESER